MKNDRTPRTMADAEFTVGHPEVYYRRPTAWDPGERAVLVVAALALLAYVCGVFG